MSDKKLKIKMPAQDFNMKYNGKTGVASMAVTPRLPINRDNLVNKHFPSSLASTPKVLVKAKEAGSGSKSSRLPLDKAVKVGGSSPNKKGSSPQR